MATRGLTLWTLQAKIRQAKQYTSLQTEQKQSTKDTKDHKGQPNSVNRPTRTEKIGEPQEQKHHKEILSVHIDDMQKSTYNAKVSSTEATALFDSGTMLRCISK